MKGEGFWAFSSVALAADRASLRSSNSCECLVKWGPAWGAGRISSFAGLWPQFWGAARVALCLRWTWVLGVLLCLFWDYGHWLCALSWPPTKSGGKELQMLTPRLGQGATKRLCGNTVPPCDLAPRGQADSFGGLYFPGGTCFFFFFFFLFSLQMMSTGWGRAGCLQG